MRVRMVAAVMAVAGLSLAAAGPAAAVPQHGAGHRSSGPRQVSGVLLGYELLPDDFFGSAYVSYLARTTGAGLLPARTRLHVPSVSCGVFQVTASIGEYGDTAGAFREYYAAPGNGVPGQSLQGMEVVNQFVSTRAATAFYDQALARYRDCAEFTESISWPAPSQTGGWDYFTGSSLDLSAEPVVMTDVGGHQGFYDDQEYGGGLYWVNAMFVVAGTDVYHFWDIGEGDNEPSATLMAELIHRVQRLY